MQKQHYIIVVAVVIIGFFIYFQLVSQGKENLQQELASTTLPQLTDEVGEDERLVEMVTSKGTMKIKLFEKLAPKAVENFLTHSENGYYDNIPFYRVIEDAVIISGDPTGTGQGGESIYGEFFDDEYSSKLYHIKGALSMHNTGPDTNASQFFFVQGSKLTEKQLNDLRNNDYPEQIIDAYEKYGGMPWLDPAHTIFGHVIEGIEVIDEIASVEVDENKRPKEEVIIEEINILK